MSPANHCDITLAGHRRTHSRRSHRHPSGAWPLSRWARWRGDRTFGVSVSDEMNWVQLAWIMMSAASLTLGVIHLLVWFKQRSKYAHLLFFALAISAAAFGAFEMAMMRAQSPAAYAATLRWAHVPLAMVVLSIVWFVHFYFEAGRLWLAYAASGLRLLALGLNFVTGVNINFREVSSLDQVMLWGGAVVSGPVVSPIRGGSCPKLATCSLPRSSSMPPSRSGVAAVPTRVGARRSSEASPTAYHRRRGFRGLDHVRAGPCPHDRHAGSFHCRPGDGL